MDLKILALISFQLIISINLTAGQRRPPFRLPTLRPTPPVIVANFVNCTQYSTSRDYWVKYTYNGVQSKYCYLYPSYYTYATTWHQAYNYCRLKNATLLSIHDYYANYILSHPSKLKSGYGEIYWIGLNSLDGRRGDYKWSDGTPKMLSPPFAKTTSTSDPLPRNVKDQGRCVSMRVTAQNSPFRNNYKNTGLWFKDDCNINHRYICQKNNRKRTPPPTPPPPAKGGCPSGWYNANQKCIKYFAQPLTFDQANQNCYKQTNGQNRGELLTIHSQMEQDFLTSLAGTGIRPAYLGLHKTNYYSAWAWTDQSASNYGNFGVQFNVQYGSNRLCAIMATNSTQAGKWLSVYCTDKRPYFCEVSRDPSTGTGTGINFLAKKCNITGFGNFIQYRKSCYSIIDNPTTKLTYLDAENHCKALGAGAHLTSIVDTYEQTFLKYFISQNKKTRMFLIGLQSKGQSDTNDTQLFEWSDGWPVYFTDWQLREPKLTSTPQDQCVVLTNGTLGGIGTWKTVSCNSPYSYICKVTKKSVPKVRGPTNGVCPKLIGNTDKSLNWVNLHKGSQFCYWFSTERKGIKGSTGFQTWSDASFHCRRRNGTLISIHSQHDVKILQARITKYGYFGGTWIGLSKNPLGELMWEDGSPVDFTNWSPDEIYKNSSDLNDDSGRVCVEWSYDGTWKQVACSGNKRNYFVCQTMKLFAPNSNSSSHGGRTAGIVIGTLLGIGALVAIGIYVMRRSNLKVPQMPSFENPIRSQRGNGNKPQEFHNTSSSPSDLTHTSNENPFQNKSFE